MQTSFVCSLLLVASAAGCGSQSPSSDAVSVPYLQRRASLQTRLIRKSPAPQDWESEKPPAHVEEVKYPSGGLQLKAWVYRPPQAKDERLPALVYFHGGFAFGSSELYACEPFMDEGFVVMAPMLRGENGHRAPFELFFGEVDDGKAAVNWLAKQPYIDTKRIYTFGHSVGGGISALLSLMDGAPIRHGGSSGGLYDAATFDQWSDIVPFDRSNPQEIELRTLVGNVRWMRRRHYAYLGQSDIAFHEAAQAAQRESPPGASMLDVIMVPGDHFTSFDNALERYLTAVKQNP